VSTKIEYSQLIGFYSVIKNIKGIVHHFIIIYSPSWPLKPKSLCVINSVKSNKTLCFLKLFFVISF